MSVEALQEKVISIQDALISGLRRELQLKDDVIESMKREAAVLEQIILHTKSADSDKL